MPKQTAWLNRPSIAGSRISADRMYKRAEALEECAGHLRQDWTEDPEEREEGNMLSAMLQEEAAAWRDRARRFSGWMAGPYTAHSLKKN